VAMGHRNQADESISDHWFSKQKILY